MIDLTESLISHYAIRPGIVGRYSVSGIWGINNGFTSVKEFLSGKKVTAKEAIRMSNGKWKHNQIQELLGTHYKIEEKVEKIMVGVGWKLVGKVDFMDDGTIYEIKTTDFLLTAPKPWHESQVKLYCTLFERPVGHIVQPIIKDGHLILKLVGSVKRDDMWFEDEMLKLNEFHKKLIKEQPK